MTSELPTLHKQQTKKTHRFELQREDWRACYQ